MPRSLRVFEPNISVHVIHRGHNQMMIFGDAADSDLFLSLLRNSAERFAVAVHGFALMTNHYHLIVTPADAEALPRAMKRVNVKYVKYFNRKYERSGTLFGGRYRAFLIGDETYWLTCLRYVEMNPVRARMVRDPRQYLWSSYHAHAVGDRYSWLTAHPVYAALGSTWEDRRTAYRAFCSTPMTESDLVLLRLHPAPAR